MGLFGCWGDWIGEAEPGVSRTFERVGFDHRENYILGEGNLGRIIISRSHGDETGIIVHWDQKDAHVQIMPVLDRAHFPTSEDVKEVR